MRFRHYVALGALAWGPWLLTGVHGETYTLLHASRFDTASLSDIGRQVFALEQDSLFARSEHFYLLAPDRETLDTMAAEAEFAYERIRRIFRGEYDAEPALLAMMRSSSTWDALASEHGLREDGLAVQTGRELYFKDDDAMQARPDRLFHEIVHLRLRELHGEALPLWLEEGLANHYGWRHAVDYNRLRGIELTREFPMLDERELFNLQDLLELRDYPESPARARIFYRQAEAMVRLLDERFSRSKMTRFLEMMRHNSPALMDERGDARSLSGSSSSSPVTTERGPPSDSRITRPDLSDDASEALLRFRYASGLDNEAEAVMLEKLRDETLSPTMD
jgi:hypothetical protein